MKTFEQFWAKPKTNWSVVYKKIRQWQPPKPPEPDTCFQKTCLSCDVPLKGDEQWRGFCKKCDDFLEK